MAKKKILIADDELIILKLMKSRLVANGYDVKTVSNGLEAVGEAQRWQPDLILLDVIMPVLDGLEACKRLKADPATRNIPIVVITASPHRGLGQKCVEEGALELVKKPFNSSDLLAIIKKTFNGNGSSHNSHE
ncbi:MAG: hypothetical protein A3C35_03220 [Omnitrophica bacterium RIFCSPHIGHO2_02_FULL_46_11]|nr:MAG: hypothetical protein A3C35_03220 [Omnitrophica bacterium RIFCSPHIGHO2_02_FULL_46_11]OGW87543.1 MAG: hypothetical protein A3A81_03225 [Omnitrophica bacterium RIFCSPLOWO2_01_FULL_45_10b]